MAWDVSNIVEELHGVRGPEGAKEATYGLVSSRWNLPG